MKANKRILSVVLVLVMCFLSAVVAVSAEENTGQSNQMYKDIVFKTLGWDASSDEYLYDFVMAYNADGATLDGGAIPDYIVAFASISGVSDAIVETTIGNYFFYSGCIYYPYELGYLIFSTEENRIYSLREAWNLRLPNIEVVLERLGTTKKSFYADVFEEYLRSTKAFPEIEATFNIYTDIWYDYSERFFYSDGIGSTEFPEATPDYVLIYASFNAHSPSFSYGIIGDYVITNLNCGNPDCLRYYIYTPADGKTYTLLEAYEAEVEGIVSVFTDYGIGELMGDANGDRKLTIKDATYIQKCLAKMDGVELPEGFTGHNVTDDGDYDDYYINIADFDDNNTVNIKDATAIQKRLAKMDI